MRQPFWVAYLAAAVLLLIAFRVVALAVESHTFAIVCYALSIIGLLANYLLTHTSSSIFRTIGSLMWFGGILGVITSFSNDWRATIVEGATGDIIWLMTIATIATVAVYLVGRWWGEFYAALSFIVVPVLSIFGLSIPMVANLEIVLALISAMVVGVFLVSTESMLLRWKRGQLGDVKPKLLLNYCWRLAVIGSATVLTIGLLLVPPAILLQAPLSYQLLKLPVLPLLRFNQNAVEFPDLFTMPGGPVALPETELFWVKGTTYPRWRVRTYVYYVGSGWRVSAELEAPQLPSLKVKDGFVEMTWRPESKPALPSIEASVSTSLSHPLLISPGEVVKLKLKAIPRGIILRTKSGCLFPISSSPIGAYIVAAIPIPETLPPRGSTSLSPEERQVLTYFPPYLYRVRELALQVVRGIDKPYEKAKALETFLRTQYRYSDSPPYLVGRHVDAVTFFLFEAKEGACDWFASALALMCRAVGIPARVVTGFYSEEVSEDGTLIIRTNDAHAWVEAYIDGHGWVTLDATPSGERRGFNLWQALQKWLSRRYRAYFANPYAVWWSIAALWVLGMMPTVWRLGQRAWWRVKPKPKWQIVVHCYLTAVQIGRKAGLNLHPNATPWENAESCDQMPRFPVIGRKVFRELADLTVAVIYAGEEPTCASVKRAKRLLKVFRQQIRLYKNWFAPRQDVKKISLQTLRQLSERL